MITQANTDEARFEALAKRVADAMAEHDTAGEAWRESCFSKHNGNIYWRMWKGERKNGVKSVANFMATRYSPPLVIDPAELECFYDHVFSNLVGGGWDVEWEEVEEIA